MFTTTIMRLPCYEFFDIRKTSTQKIPTWNIPTQVFLIFCLLLPPSSLILLKNYFLILYLKTLKSDLLRCIKRICSLSAKMATYSKTFCWSSMIIGHYYIPRVCFEYSFLWSFSWRMWCYSIQSSLNLNSSFSIRLLINWLICWFIYRSENNCLELHYCIM